jgi:hypothetical protein
VSCCAIAGVKVEIVKNPPADRQGECARVISAPYRAGVGNQHARLADRHERLS